MVVMRRGDKCACVIDVMVDLVGRESLGRACACQLLDRLFDPAMLDDGALGLPPEHGKARDASAGAERDQDRQAMILRQLRRSEQLAAVGGIDQHRVADNARDRAVMASLAGISLRSASLVSVHGAIPLPSQQWHDAATEPGQPDFVTFGIFRV
jgi:hypothetical protein